VAVAEVIASAFASGFSWGGDTAGKRAYCAPPVLKARQIMSAFEEFLKDNPNMADQALRRRDCGNAHQIVPVRCAMKLVQPAGRLLAARRRAAVLQRYLSVLITIPISPALRPPPSMLRCRQRRARAKSRGRCDVAAADRHRPAGDPAAGLRRPAALAHVSSRVLHGW
jgi:hypothetical protein